MSTIVLSSSSSSGTSTTSNPVTVAFGSSVTINSTAGSIFRCVATGNLTLADIIGGASRFDGKVIAFEVLASGADRVVTIGSDTITVPSGKWWTGTFRYHFSGDTWVWNDETGGTGSAITVDGTAVPTLAISSTAVTATDVGALPATGGSATGDISSRDSGTTKALRVRGSSGTGVAIESGAENLVLATFTTAAFGGTERQYARLSKDAHEWQFGGEVQFRLSIGGTTVHDINPVDGVAALGAKNGLTNLRFCGYKATTGAPTTGTWAVGDLVMDSAKVWWRCSSSGTPGTWV